MIVQIVPIVPVVSKNVQAIGTIIWKHFPDDRRRSQTTRTIGTITIVRIELYSIRLNFFLKRLGRSRRSGRSYGNQALMTDEPRWARVANSVGQIAHGTLLLFDICSHLKQKLKSKQRNKVNKMSAIWIRYGNVLHGCDFPSLKSKSY